MTYRVPSIDIPDNNPFQNDALQRKDVVEFLAGLLGRAGGPFVLVLDSPYGTGKSTVVEMLRVVLRKENFQCIYFNAWQFDYVNDPMGVGHRWHARGRHMGQLDGYGYLAH